MMDPNKRHFKHQYTNQGSLEEVGKATALNNCNENSLSAKDMPFKLFFFLAWIDDLN